MKFAVRMGWHIVSLARYETKRTPGHLALFKLRRVAIEQGRSDLLGAFTDAAWPDELACPACGYDPRQANLN